MAKNTWPIDEMQRILDSDDELPSDYEEVMDIPAYEDDTRFEVVNFPWLQNANLNPAKAEEPTQKILYKNKIKTIVDHLRKGEKVLLRKGVLSTQDILCLKSFIAFGDTGPIDSLVTLYWFTEFLLQKDLQANYKFLKSCLVTDITCEISQKKVYVPNITESECSDLFKLDILIK